MPDSILDDPEFVQRRRHFWTTVLSDPRFSAHTTAVAVRSGDLVGLAMSGPARDPDAGGARQLFVLYTFAAVHGTGAGAALLDAVVDPSQSAFLWVADPNPRAQAFYRKHGFRADGTVKTEDGVREIRMVRSPTD
ncbi:GNAT family N-acetyltransferase [Leifsonia shinshuensis]|uniref:GNAT family N-acetyltransferase n=1 Tax=Leifsonia shinshuensis TaxID=150026 RepID=UPI002861BDD1|nr:GNAT family N-acetyltransferase [Leifsonia shinshuensis]MDR6972980.1 GNAT superfamily N-acetyltransferase [Leifsonia shinshuensis]